LSFKFNNLQHTHEFQVHRGTAAACAANRDGNSEYSPIFYREFTFQELWLPSAWRAVMSNEAIDELAHN